MLLTSTDRPGWTRRPAARWGLVAAIAVLVATLVAWAVVAVLVRSLDDRVLAGVTVAGEPVGGLERAGLDAVVRARSDDHLVAPVRVRTDDETLRTDRRDVGVTVDEDRMAQDAWQRGRRGVWRALADHVRSRSGAELRVPIRQQVAPERLEEWSTRAAGALASDPRPHRVHVAPAGPDDPRGAVGIALDPERADVVDLGVAEVVVEPAEPGRDVDPDDVRETVRPALDGTGPVELTVASTPRDPVTTDADVQAVLAALETAFSAEVRLVNPSPADDLVLAPEELAQVLAVTPDAAAPPGSRLALTTSTSTVLGRLGPDGLASLETAALPAAIDVEDGMPVVREETPGFTVDLDRLGDRVVEVARRAPGDREADLPGTALAPAVTAADADRVLDQATQALAAPVVLVNPSPADDLVLEPDDLAEVLTFRLRDGDGDDALEIGTSPERLVDHLGDDAVAGLETGPVEGSLTVSGGEVQITGGTPGFAVDLRAAAQRVVELARATDEREAGLPGEVTQPDVTRQDLLDLGIEQEVASFTTTLVPGQQRNTNIQRGAEIVDGTILRPGERFSLDDTLGPRTRSRGFVEGGFIRDGEIVEVVGGGVSQLATTFMNAAWFAGIRLVEFQPHSFAFARYPDGREATISRNTVDLVVENDSPHAIYVVGRATDSEVTFSFWSTPWAEVDTWTGERRNVVPGEVRDGFDISFGRTITYPDGSTREESYSHRYRPEDEPPDEDGSDDA